MRTFLFLALATLSSACAVPRLGVQPRYEHLALSGGIGATATGLRATSDLDAAGLETNQTLGGRLDLDLGSPHWIVLAQGPRFEGDGTLTAELSLGGETLPVGTDVESRVDLDQYALALVFDVVPGDTVELGLGLGATYLGLDFDFQGDVAGSPVRVASREQLPVPLFVVAGGVWIGPVEIGVYLGAMDIEVGSDSARYLDADLYVRCRVLGGEERLRASVLLGVRRTTVDVEYEDEDSAIDAELDLDGLFVGLELTL
jgi:hypothetical protein